MDKQINIKISETGGDNVLRLMIKLDKSVDEVTGSSKEMSNAVSGAMATVTDKATAAAAAMSKFNSFFRSGLPSIKNFSAESMAAFREMISAKNELDKVMNKSPNQFSSKKVVAELEAASRKADETKRKFDALQGTGKTTKTSTTADAVSTTMVNNTKAYNKELQSSSSYLKVIWTYYKLMAGAKLLDIGATAIQHYADTYADITNQIKAANAEGIDFVAINKQVYGIAQKSRVDYTATAKLFNRITMSNDTLRMSMQQVAILTEAITKSFTISGASAGEAAAATLQIGQALSKGIVNGDELRSVLENNAVIAKILSDEFGVSRGQLVQMGAEGKITSEIFAGALLKNSKAINEQFSRMTPTIGQAREQLANALEQTLGMYAANSELSKVIVGWIQRITQFVEGGKLTIILDTIGKIVSALSSTGISIGTIARGYLAWKVGTYAAQKAAEAYNAVLAITNIRAKEVAVSTKAAAVSASLLRSALISTGIGALTVVVGELVSRYLAMRLETEANKQATDELLRSLSGYNKELDKTAESTQRATEAINAMSASELRGALFKADAQLDASRTKINALTKAAADYNYMRSTASPYSRGAEVAMKEVLLDIEKQIASFGQLNDTTQQTLLTIATSGKSASDIYKELNTVLVNLQTSNFKAGTSAEEMAASYKALGASIEDIYAGTANAEGARTDIAKRLGELGIPTTKTDAPNAASYINVATESAKSKEVQVKLQPILDIIGAEAITDDSARRFRDSFNASLQRAYAENANSTQISDLIKQQLNTADIAQDLKTRLNEIFSTGSDPMQKLTVSVTGLTTGFGSLQSEAENAATSIISNFTAVRNTLNSVLTMANSAVAALNNVQSAGTLSPNMLGSIQQ